MKITKEQIIALEKGEVTAKELFPELFEMKVGSFYKHNDGCVINYLGDTHYNIKVFGFNAYGFWRNTEGWSKHGWTEITPEEALPYFVKEAEKRGFVKGAYFTTGGLFCDLDAVGVAWKLIDGCLYLSGIIIMTSKGEWIARIVKKAPRIKELVKKDPRISELINKYGKEELIKMIQK